MENNKQKQKKTKMKYIQLENFFHSIHIVTENDDSGDPAIFSSLKDAQETLSENCQNGVVVPLGVDMIYLVRELYEAYKNDTDIVHIGDLIANVLDEHIVFHPKPK